MLILTTISNRHKIAANYSLTQAHSSVDDVKSISEHSRLSDVVSSSRRMELSSLLNIEHEQSHTLNWRLHRIPSTARLASSTGEAQSIRHRALALSVNFFCRSICRSIFLTLSVNPDFARRSSPGISNSVRRVRQIWRFIDFGGSLVISQQDNTMCSCHQMSYAAHERNVFGRYFKHISQ